MKIAFFLFGFPVLSETFILSQITSLMDAGHDVDIYSALPREPGAKQHPDVEHYNLLSHTVYYGHPWRNRPLLYLLLGLIILLKNLPIAPIKTCQALNIRKYGPNILDRLYYLDFFLNRSIQHYDILHAHFGPNGIRGAFLRDMGFFTGKLVTTFHGFDFSKTVHRYGKHYYDYLFKVGDLFLTISKDCLSQITSLGASSAKCGIHRVGFERRKFPQRTFARQALNPARPLMLLSIARLTEKKGLEYGIRAVAELREHYPDLQYHILGDGELREPLADLIGNLGLQPSVRLHGWKSQDEVAAYLADADILLVPSVTGKNGDQEGLPTVIYEAMAQGVLVIASRHAGIPEVVIHHETGLLVAERDVNGLAQQLTWILQHPDQYEVITQNASQYVQQHHDQVLLCRQQVQYYARLIQLAASDELKSLV